MDAGRLRHGWTVHQHAMWRLPAPDGSGLCWHVWLTSWRGSEPDTLETCTSLDWLYETVH
jgi:hypothetical protein